jgi:hypothetical protein
MIAFLKRLRLALRVLRAKKFVVFLPDYKRPLTMEMGTRGQINVLAWQKIQQAVADEHAQALRKADARLLADVDAGRVQEARLMAGFPVQHNITLSIDGSLLAGKHFPPDAAV